MHTESEGESSNESNTSLFYHTATFFLEIGVFTMFMCLLAFYVLPRLSTAHLSIGGVKLPLVTKLAIRLSQLSLTVPLIPLLPSACFVILGWFLYSSKNKFVLFLVHVIFILFTTFVLILTWFSVVPLLKLHEPTLY